MSADGVDVAGGSATTGKRVLPAAATLLRRQQRASSAMLQALMEKQATYRNHWSTRRVVFEPTHRYLLYSDALTSDSGSLATAEAQHVQDAIAACTDTVTSWKHKIRVVRIVREAELKSVPTGNSIDDVKERTVVRISGYLRSLGTSTIAVKGHDSAKRAEHVTTAAHAVYDEASPLHPSIYGGGAHPRHLNPDEEADEGDDEADEDEDADTDSTGSLVEYKFRFASESVFHQWFYAITRALEQDALLRVARGESRQTAGGAGQPSQKSLHHAPCPGVLHEPSSHEALKHCFALPQEDPRFHIPFGAPIPLPYLHALHVLEGFVYYAFLRCTRVYLDPSKHHDKPPREHHDALHHDAGDHGSTKEVGKRAEEGELHLLRYQNLVPAYDAPMFLLLTDHVLYYLRADGKVVSNVNLVDVDDVWFNTTAAEPFVIFKTRKGLADLVLLMHPRDAGAGSVSALYGADTASGALGSNGDTTALGGDGVQLLVVALRRLVLHTAALRLKSETSILTAPALRQHQQATKSIPNPGREGTAGDSAASVHTMQFTGLNVYDSLEEFLTHDDIATDICWRAAGAAHELTTPHIQVQPTPRHKLLLGWLSTQHQLQRSQPVGTISTATSATHETEDERGHMEPPVGNPEEVHDPTGDATTTTTAVNASSRNDVAREQLRRHLDAHRPPSIATTTMAARPNPQGATATSNAAIATITATITAAPAVVAQPAAASSAITSSTILDDLLASPQRVKKGGPFHTTKVLLSPSSLIAAAVPHPADHLPPAMHLSVSEAAISAGDIADIFSPKRVATSHNNNLTAKTQPLRDEAPSIDADDLL